ncbi:MAG: GAF domain-containing protein [Acidimicrobiia bacterium]|nr:GAF domain-containing protein [Acidimicrobiia bacterium]
MPVARKTPARFKDRAELLDFLLDVTGAIASTLDLDTLLDNIAQIIRQVVPYDLFAILLYSEKSKGLRIRHGIGHSIELMRETVIPLDEGLTGLAASARIPVVVGDVRSDPRYLPLVDAVQSEMAIPMTARGRLVGVIDMQSSQPDAYSSEDSALIQLIASRVANSILNARLYRRVERQNRTLKTLANISLEFSSTLNLDELLNKVATTVRGLINYDAFAVLLYDEANHHLRHRFSLRYDQRVQSDNIPFGKGITGSAAELRQPVLVEDTKNDPRYIETHAGIRSEVAIPLLMPDRLLGVMDLESERLGFFTQDHVQTLGLLAPLVAQAVENARLYEEVAAGKKRMEADLEAARDLQAMLLPKEDPTIAGLEIGVGFRPAHEISGDVFDFFEQGDDYAIISFGDVSGKSASAALYGAMVTGLLRTLAPRRRNPSALMRTLNDSLMERRAEGKYLTLLVSLWQPATGLLTMANAASTPPMICRGRQIILPKLEGLPLGLFEGQHYEEVPFQTEPGDVILFYSDGIQDQHNPQGQEFGLLRLAPLLRKLRKLPARQIVDAIFEDFDKFRGEHRVFDDQTLVVMKVTGKRNHDVAG